MSDAAARRAELEARNAAMRDNVDNLMADLRRRTSEFAGAQARAAAVTGSANGAATAIGPVPRSPSQRSAVPASTTAQPMPTTAPASTERLVTNGVRPTAPCSHVPDDSARDVAR